MRICHQLFFMLSKSGYSRNFSLTYFTTENMVLQKSSLNFKEEIVHFFKNIELQHEKID